MRVGTFTELMNFLLELLGVVTSCGEMKTIMLPIIKGENDFSGSMAMQRGSLGGLGSLFILDLDK